MSIYTLISPKIRACTGFDGGFEDWEAIHGSDHVKTETLNLNADENLALAA